MMATELSYTQLKEKLAAGQSSFVLIDVREKKEYAESRIPGSVNVPLGDIPAAFQLDDSAFKTKYGGNKPKKTDQVTFHCRSGVRAGKAVSAMSKSGYNNLLIYKPGMLEWAEKEKK